MGALEGFALGLAEGAAEGALVGKPQHQVVPGSLVMVAGQALQKPAPGSMLIVPASHGVHS